MATFKFILHLSKLLTLGLEFHSMKCLSKYILFSNLSRKLLKWWLLTVNSALDQLFRYYLLINVFFVIYQILSKCQIIASNMDNSTLLVSRVQALCNSLLTVSTDIWHELSSIFITFWLMVKNQLGPPTWHAHYGLKLV